MKDLLFSQVRAYNVIQMFSSVTECLNYTTPGKYFVLCTTGLIVTFHYLKSQGTKCFKILQEDIQVLNEDNSCYLVKSQTEL